MADTFVAVHDNCLASQHGQYVALGTNRGASLATDAVCGIDMRMLGLWSFGKHFPLLGSFACLFLPLLELAQIAADEDQSDHCSDHECDEVVHAFSLEVAHRYYCHNM